MSKEPIPSGAAAVENGEIAAVFERACAIVESRKSYAADHANRELTMMFREIGRYVNSNLLENRRAAYGKKIPPTLSAKLTAKYGGNLSEQNLYRMTLFADRFADAEILPTLSEN
jgi:hypothetical protein